MKILIFWKCHVGCFFFFFLSQEDGLGSAENKETATKMQHQEAKMSATNQEGCFFRTFLFPPASLFPPLCLLPFLLLQLWWLHKILCRAQICRHETKQDRTPWSLFTWDFPERLVRFLGVGGMISWRVILSPLMNAYFRLVPAQQVLFNIPFFQTLVQFHSCLLGYFPTQSTFSLTKINKLINRLLNLVF